MYIVVYKGISLICLYDAIAVVCTHDNLYSFNLHFLIFLQWWYNVWLFVNNAGLTVFWFEVILYHDNTFHFLNFCFLNNNGQNCDSYFFCFETFYQRFIINEIENLRLRWFSYIFIHRMQFCKSGSNKQACLA